MENKLYYRRCIVALQITNYIIVYKIYWCLQVWIIFGNLFGLFVSYVFKQGNIQVSF